MSKSSSTKPLSSNLALQKMLQYCAYQERCWLEVRLKIKSLKIPAQDTDAILHYLKENNYVDETRYASAVVRGKFNQKKWGRIKIINELRSKSIDEKIIHDALEEISMIDYEDAIKKIYEEKINEYQDEQAHIIRDKAVKFLISKGYEYALIDKTIREKGVSQLKLF